MRPFSSLLLGAALALSGVPAVAAGDTPARGQAALAKALDGHVAGKPVDCINLSDIQSTEIIDHVAILYRVGGGRLFVNTPQMGQDALRNDDILVTKTWGTQLCRLDTVRLIDRGAGFETGFVGLGDFVPYTKVAAR